MASFKQVARTKAFENGITRCPCCKVQLMWKPSLPKIQKNFATVDHIVPNSIGGSDSVRNMFVMCRSCNEKRGNTCFVNFVTSHGVSKSYAEEIYRDAHVETLQRMIAAQFTQNESSALTKKINKKRRENIKKIVRNYVDYFGDYLPVFELLEKIL